MAPAPSWPNTPPMVVADTRNVPGADTLVEQRPHRREEVLRAPPVEFAERLEVERSESRFDVERREPVDAGDRAVGQPRPHLPVERIRRRRVRDRQDHDATLGEAIGQRAARTTLVVHDDDARARRQRHAGRLAHVGRRPQGGDDHATRCPIGVGQVAARRNGRARAPTPMRPRWRRRSWRSQRSACASSGAPSARDACWRSQRRREVRPVAEHEADHVLQRREVPQLEVVLPRDVERLAHRRKGLGLLDGVHPEVRLEVEVHVEHVRRIARLLRHDFEHLRRHRIEGAQGRALAPAKAQCAPRRARASGRACDAEAGEASEGARSGRLLNTKPTTCFSVGKSRSFRLS